MAAHRILGAAPRWTGGATAAPGCCLLVILAAIVPLPPDRPGPDKGGALTPLQQREVTDLLNQFRKAAGDAAVRKKAADRIFEIGGQAPARLLAAVNGELNPLFTAYQQALVREGLQALHARLAGGKSQEVESLRRTIIDTVADPGLSKEAVVAKADPALKKLEGILLVDAEGLLAAAPALKQQRDRLAALGEFWQRCTDHMAKTGAVPAAVAAEVKDFTRTLQGAEEAAVLQVLAPDDSARRVLADNVGLEAKIRPEEAAGIRLTNRLRMVAGLAPLRIGPVLCDAARDHSKDMATQGFFAHESPVPGKKQPWDRAKRFGTTASAENIFMGSDKPADAIMGWWHSPGHLKSMMGKYSRLGLGRYGKHWTQMFG